MSTGLTIAIAGICLAVGLAGGAWLAPHRRRAARERPRPVRRILLPFPGQAIEVDARVARGRTYRDGLRRIVEQERFDRIIVSATDSPHRSLTSGDLEWLLERVPAEVMILRPAPDDTRAVSANSSQPRA